MYKGKPLVNSVTGEEERLERVLPLVKKYGAAVVAISNDDTGISEDPDVRFEVAKRIVERAADHGIPREDVIVDPLVMPIGAMPTAGQQVFRAREPPARGARGQHDLRRVQRELRHAGPRAHQRRVPADGDRQRPDLRDHEPAAAEVVARSWPPTCSWATTRTPAAGSGPTVRRAAEGERGRRVNRGRGGAGPTPAAVSPG